MTENGRDKNIDSNMDSILYKVVFNFFPNRTYTEDWILSIWKTVEGPKEASSLSERKREPRQKTRKTYDYNKFGLKFNKNNSKSVIFTSSFTFMFSGAILIES